MLNQIRPRQKQLLVLSLLLAAAFYLAIIIWAGYDDILRTLGKLSAADWLLLFICSIGNYSLRFVRWHLYTITLGFQINKALNFLYYLAGFALTTTPAKAGELLRSFYLKAHGVPYRSSIAMFVSERFLDVLIMACLASLTVYLFGDYAPFVLIATLIIVTLLLLIKTPVFRHLLQAACQRLPYVRLQNLLRRLLELLQTAQRLLQTKLLVAALTLAAVAWSIQGLAFYYIVQTLGFDILVTAAMGIYAISLLAGAASFIPGGIGGTEVVMGLLLAASGADTQIAISAPLVSRLSTLWFAVAVGLVANALLGSKTRPASQ